MTNFTCRPALSLVLDFGLSPDVVEARARTIGGLVYVLADDAVLRGRSADRPTEQWDPVGRSWIELAAGEVTLGSMITEHEAERRMWPQPDQCPNWASAEPGQRRMRMGRRQRTASHRPFRH